MRFAKGQMKKVKIVWFLKWALAAQISCIHWCSIWSFTTFSTLTRVSTECVQNQSFMKTVWCFEDFSQSAGPYSGQPTWSNFLVVFDLLQFCDLGLVDVNNS